LNILVTGGAGYIGSHFVKRAIAAGESPVVYDNLSEGHRWAVLAEHFHEASLADRDVLVKVLRDESIDAVVHFAANAYVGESVENPSKYFNNNYVGTLSLLDAMVEAGVNNLIFSSTCAVYGVPDQVPITEETPRDPINPYGLTKHFVERTLEWYASAYGLKYVALRYFNAAGADPEGRIGEVHDPETHLIPLVLYAAAGKRERIEVFGDAYPTPDGTCIRDYIHVEDLADAHLLALDYLKGGGKSGSMNLGTERGTSVLEIINAAREVTGRAIPVKVGQRRPGDPPVLVASSERAHSELGWTPLFTDIRLTVEHAWGWLQTAMDKGYIT
jgi:UDP-glucose-4-epimerase GalE